jgi:hypothetical protein
MSATIALACLLLVGEQSTKADPADLAQRIDERLQVRFDSEQVLPAERAADDEFLRRLSLDLIGRIPTPKEVQRFLADASITKRELLIDQLLGSKEHARHFARVWRALLMPESEVEPQLRYFEPGLEAWLQERRQDNVGFDGIVRELLTVPIVGPNEQPQVVLRDLRRPNPLAFIAAKNADPAKIASASTRLFLGLRLECAQCHNHPFDNWSQEQFWNQAAFFAGIERRGRGPFAPLVEVTTRRTISLMDSDQIVSPAFLDQSQPRLTDDGPARAELARWITAPENPYFARAITNRVWSQLFGTGIVEPVDDIRDSNAPSHPELLRELSESFAAADFDVALIYRALCRTAAYQRTSRQSDPSQSRAELFAKMPVRPLSGEQFFDSLALAVAYESTADRSPGEPERDPVRQAVLGLFAGASGGGNPQTSVAQALALMNGDVTDGAIRPKSGARLQQIINEFPESSERQIEVLYLSTLSRLPTQEETQTLIDFNGLGDKTSRQQNMGDIFWMLLNSAEFCWNH